MNLLPLLILIQALLVSCDKDTEAHQCSDVLAAQVYAGNRIAAIEHDIAKLADNRSCVIESRSCPPCLDRTSEIQAEMTKASNAQRQLDYIRGGIRHAVETWKSPDGTYEDAVTELQNLENE